MNIQELTHRATEIREKYAAMEKTYSGKPWTTSQIMEGFVGDIGDLMKLVMAKEGARNIDDVDKKLAHELADCLWCILVLAKRFDIDIEKAFLHTMDVLEKRISEHA